MFTRIHFKLLSTNWAHFKMDCFKVEKCSMVRRVQIWHSCRKSQPLWPKRETFRRVICVQLKNVSGYVCNHGSPSGERDTASPRGRYGERPQRDSVWRYIWKNTTCWPATAHDVTTGVPQYKCRREDTSSASSSEACVRSMAQSPGDAVSRSPLGEPWLHT